jgi:ATP-dependent DNA helicase Q4
VALLDDADFVRLRSLAFSSVLDRQAVQGLLEAVFSPAALGEQRQGRGGAGRKISSRPTTRGKKSVKRKAVEPADSEAGEAEEQADGLDESRLQEEPAGSGGAATVAAPSQGDEAAPASNLDGTAGRSEADGCAALPHHSRRFGVLAIKKLAAELDMREESMESVLSYLEAGAQPCLRTLPPCALTVKVSFYAVPAEQLAQQHPVVQVSPRVVQPQGIGCCCPYTVMVGSVHSRQGCCHCCCCLQSVLEACPHPRNGIYNTPVARLAGVAQQAPGVVLWQLRELAAASMVGFELSRQEGLAYEVRRGAEANAHAAHHECSASQARRDYALKAEQLLTAAARPMLTQILQPPDDVEGFAKQLLDRLAAVLAAQVSRLDVTYRALAAAASASQAAEGGAQEAGAAQEAVLREAIEGYFDSSQAAPSSALASDVAGLPLKRADPALLQAVQAVVRRNGEQAGPALSARAVARILHGLGSPGFPTDAWSKRMGAFWGSQTRVDFAAIFKAAEIVAREHE